MSLPRKAEESQVLHCGWTDPRDRLNWHVRSFVSASGAPMIAFRRAGQDEELLTSNRFGAACDRLEDHQIAILLDQAKKAAAAS